MGAKKGRVPWNKGLKGVNGKQKDVKHKIKDLKIVIFII